MLSRTGRWGSSPKCWKTIENFFRRSSRRRAGLAAQDVLAVEVDLAQRRLDQAGQAADERGLAAARQPHDDEDLAGLDVERDVADRDRPALGRDGSFDGVGVRRRRRRLATFASAGPKTFHRSRTVSPPAAPSGIGSVMVALTLRTNAVAARASAAEPACGTRCRVLPDVLGLTVLVQTAGAKFPSDARLLEAAPLGLRAGTCCSR